MEHTRCTVRRNRRAAAYLAPLACLAILASGCSNAVSAGESTAPMTSTRTTAAQPVPLQQAGIGRKTRRPDAEALAISMTAMAVTRQGDHDQAVLTFTGTAVPGWTAQYVTTPLQNGTGQVLALPGQSILEVLILETPSPFSSPAGYTGPPVVFDQATPQINTVQFSAQGAGITQVFVTINGNQPAFDVTALTNPTRIVIDVAD
jgi:hypothetical protein